MSYLGFIKTISNDYLSRFDNPQVLEIGIEWGQSTLPLIYNLSLQGPFTYVGVDILIRPTVVEQLGQFRDVYINDKIPSTGKAVYLFEENSLQWLEAVDNLGITFDTVFIDGDHNYHTVTKELDMIQTFLHEKSIIVCDDYNGRFEFKDFFYADDKEGYEDIEKATKRIYSEKQGVKTAIDDFLKENLMWQGFYVSGFEPIILYRRDVWKELSSENIADGIKLKDMKLNFLPQEKK